MTRLQVAFAVPLLILALAALLVPLPVPQSLAPWHALTQELENFGHPLAFAVLGAVVCHGLRAILPAPAWRAPLLALLVGLALGLLTEWLQTLIGRDGSLQDLWADMLGCAAAVCSASFVSKSRCGKPELIIWVMPKSACTIFL